MIRRHTSCVWRRVSGPPVTGHSSSNCLRRLPALFCAFCALLAARAQDTNTPSLQYSAPPLLPLAVETNQPPQAPPVYMPQPTPAPPIGGTSQMYVPSAASLPALPPLLRWGPLNCQLSLLYGLTYGNGLQASPSQQSASFVNTVSPGIALQWGNHWSLSYTPTIQFYSSSAFRNTFNNAVTLAGGTTYEDWTFGLSQAYVSSSDPIIETGSQTDQQTLSTSLSANYQISSKTSLQLSAGQNLRLASQTASTQQLNNYNTWSTMDWLNYQFWSRFGAAIGAGFNYDSVQTGPDMTSEQIQGRITWVVVKKLSLVLSGGGQDTQFLGSGAPNLISPIYSLSLQYSPFEVTTISLSGYSGVSPSYFSDQVTESTSISAGLSQRLLGRLYLNLSGGYGTSTYHSSTSGSASANPGNYDTTSFSASLSTSFLKRGSASIFYSVNFNSSGATVYNYTTTTVGLTLSYRY
jgi:hypothetical protein